MSCVSLTEGIPGVQQFAPAGDGLDATGQSLERFSFGEELVTASAGNQMPSYMNVFEGSLPFSHTPIEPIMKIESAEGPYLKLSTSPSTLSTASNDEDISPLSLSSASTPYSLEGQDIAEHIDVLDQLKAFVTPANNESRLLLSPLLAPSSFESRSTASFTTTDTSCPYRSHGIFVRRTRKTSYFTGKSRGKERLSSVQRPERLQTTVNEEEFTRTTHEYKSESMLSSKDLRDIENSPTHRWSMVDVEILNCLFRWYESSPNDMVEVFNLSTGRHLTKGKLQIQFNRGAKMTRKFQQSFYDIPFHDPNGRFSATRQIIKAKARTLNIGLRIRQTDNIPRYIKTLKCRTANNHDQSSISGALSSVYSGQFQHVLNTGSRPSMRLFGGYAMRTDGPFDGAPTNHPSQMPAIFARNRHLAFRVWSDSSGTRFSEKEGFVAGLHSMWNGPLLQPFQPEGDGLKAIMLLSNAHFNVGSNFPSAFISVASSLLHVLTKAFDSSSDMRMAIIDLDHPSLNTPNKRHDAAELLQQLLKKNGQAKWARYSGLGEYIFWADIPAGAIIHHFPLLELEQLARDDLDCGRVLGLSAFQPGRNTAAVASDLHKRNIILYTDVARVIGRIAKLFGLSKPSTKIAHISEWVSNFVDSFGIRKAPGQDLHTESSIAIAFAIALDSRAPSYHLQDVMLAFQSGVESGLATTAYFASRQRPKFDK